MLAVTGIMELNVLKCFAFGKLNIKFQLGKYCFDFDNGLWELFLKLCV